MIELYHLNYGLNGDKFKSAVCHKARYQHKDHIANDLFLRGSYIRTKVISEKAKYCIIFSHTNYGMEWLLFAFLFLLFRFGFWKFFKTNSYQFTQPFPIF